jgi:hypothetical protein
MAQFLLILRGDVTADYSKYTPADMERILGEYMAWGEKLANEGRLLAGHKLTDEGGKVMHPTGKSDVTVKDGPYVETKEVVGGIYLVKADSYDHAVELCQGHPNFEFGSIEVREIDFMGQPEQ